MSTTTKTKQPAPLKGGELRKKTLTVAQAADQWEKSKTRIALEEALRDEAAAVLTPYLRRTASRVYKDRIRLVQTTGALVLDQDKVKTFLGKRLPQFKKRNRDSEYLQLVNADPEIKEKD